MFKRIFLGLVVVGVCSLGDVVHSEEELLSLVYERPYHEKDGTRNREFLNLKVTDSQVKFKIKQLVPNIQKSISPWDVSYLEFHKIPISPEFQDIKWTHSPTVIGDINNDGIDDLLIMEEDELIAIVSQKKGEKFIVLHHPTYTPLPTGKGWNIFRCEEAMVEDVDKDGSNEIIMISIYTFQTIPQPLRIRVYGFDNDNKIFTQKLEKEFVNIKPEPLHSPVATTFGDVNGDGKNDLLVIANKKIYFLDISSKSISYRLLSPKIPLEKIDEIRMLDLENDGTNEILIGGSIVEKNWFKTYLQIWKHHKNNFSLVENFLVYKEETERDRVYDVGVSAIKGIDLDRDGLLEIILKIYSIEEDFVPKHIRILKNESGSWKIVWSSEIIYTIGSGPFIVDLDNDGATELIENFQQDYKEWRAKMKVFENKGLSYIEKWESKEDCFAIGIMHMGTQKGIFCSNGRNLSLLKKIK